MAIIANFMYIGDSVISIKVVKRADNTNKNKQEINASPIRPEYQLHLVYFHATILLFDIIEEVMRELCIGSNINFEFSKRE